MLCPRCSMHMADGSLVCARCGELTPRPTGLRIDTRPPGAGPRNAPALRGEIPLDRRGKGVRAVDALGPMRIRPAPVQWARGQDLRTRDRRSQAPSAGVRYEPPSPPSEIHQAKTDPMWLEQPAEPAPEVVSAVEDEPSSSVASASLGRRFLAAAVDGGVVLAAGAFATFLGLVLFGWSDVSVHFERGFDNVLDGLLVGRRLGAVLAGLLLALAIAYSVVGHALGGATLGKRLVGLRVVDSDGDVPSFGISFWRTMASCLSGAAGGLGFALALFHPDGLALHDHVVGTRVVDATEDLS